MLRHGTLLFGRVIRPALLIGIAMLLLGTEIAAAEPSAPAPAFTLKLLDGKVLTSKSLRGHPVVLRFLASW